MPAFFENEQGSSVSRRVMSAVHGGDRRASVCAALVPSLVCKCRVTFCGGTAVSRLTCDVCLCTATIFFCVLQSSAQRSRIAVPRCHYLFA